MAFETISPNMNLPVPGVALTNAPQWASDLNGCLTIIDAHTHTAGSGVPITPDAININANLSFAQNSITNLYSSQYISQASPIADLRAIYVSSKDLYYTDGDGNQVRITQAGGVAGTPGSISNLTSPASAAYSAAQSRFIWESDSNTAADMDFGAAIMRNITSGSFALTLQPPTLSNNYSITLPTLPGSQKFVTLDSLGNMGAPWSVDNSTVEISGGATLQVKALGINTAQLADNSVTTAKILPANVTSDQISQSRITISGGCGPFSTSSTTFVTVTNFSINVAILAGRPVDIRLISDSVTSGFVQTPVSGVLEWTFLKNGVVLAIGQTNVGGGAVMNIPVSSFNHVEVPAATGTFTYSMQVRSSGGTGIQVNSAKMVIWQPQA